MFWQSQRKGVSLHSQREAAERRCKCELCTDLHTFCTHSLCFDCKILKINNIMDFYTLSTRMSIKRFSRRKQLKINEVRKLLFFAHLVFCAKYAIFSGTIMAQTVKIRLN